MSRTGDPIIEPSYYLCEALDALELLCAGDGARGALCLEVVHIAMRMTLGPVSLRLSDLDRLHALFDAAAG